MGPESGGEVDIKCNTGMTEGEEEISWRHKEHDNSIITRVFFITRQYPVGIYRWAIFFSLQERSSGASCS